MIREELNLKRRKSVPTRTSSVPIFKKKQSMGGSQADTDDNTAPFRKQIVNIENGISAANDRTETTNLIVQDKAMIDEFKKIVEEFKKENKT